LPCWPRYHVTDTTTLESERDDIHIFVGHDSMPVRLRLSLHGNRNNRIFHLVAIDLRKRRDGKPIELLGIYDPRLRLGQEHKTMRWSVDRIAYWLEKGGALPSKPVVRLLERVCFFFFCTYHCVF
jgi:small subunit ribosomal protein S16